ncbi:MAG: DUF2141 domain-containing protein [Cytophagales bacterium]|nr:DUF2141 domain-containing protein [Cytophagales bacterium]
MTKLIVSTLIVLAATMGSSWAQGTLDVNVTGIESDEGKIILMLFDQREGFPSKKEKAYKRIKVTAKKGDLAYTFKDLPYGIYALSVAHDENNNDEIDTNFVGLPKERIGASYHEKFGKPSFEKSKFSLSENQQALKIDMKFLN